MAIETICKGCARKLRVGDEFAGRKARCPHCKTIYIVPAAGIDLDDVSQPAASGGDGWLLRGTDGTAYGPVSKSKLDGWLHEGRLDATSQLRQESETTWRPATDVYPMLLPPDAANVNPFSGQLPFPTSATEPYKSPGAAGTAGRGFRPHRGATILILGLVGIACCQIFSIAAWIMGHGDLKEINAGRMDPDGRGLTQAGMIVGIIGTVLMVVGIIFQVLMVVFAVAQG